MTHENLNSIEVSLDYGDLNPIKINVQIIDTTDEKYFPVFKDVNTSDTNWEFIHELHLRGIAKGDNANFYPDKYVTKAEFFMLLARALGLENTSGDIWNDQALDGIHPEDAITYNQGAKALIKAVYAFNPDKWNLFAKLSTEPGFDIENKRHISSFHPKEEYKPDEYPDETIMEHDVFLYTIPIIDPELSFTHEKMTRSEAAKAIYRFIKLMEWLDNDELVNTVKNISGILKWHY